MIDFDLFGKPFNCILQINQYCSILLYCLKYLTSLKFYVKWIAKGLLCKLKTWMWFRMLWALKIFNFLPINPHTVKKNGNLWILETNTSKQKNWSRLNSYLQLLSKKNCLNLGRFVTSSSVKHYLHTPKTSSSKVSICKFSIYSIISNSFCLLLQESWPTRITSLFPTVLLKFRCKCWRANFSQ